MLYEVITHVVDHIDNIFNLLGVNNVIREMIIHLMIGQVALFLALSN